MMLLIKQLLAGEILGGVKTVSPEGAAALTETDILNLLEYPPDPAMGDIALPCFKLSRILRRSPVQIANALAPCIGGDCVERAEAVNGYLNIYLSGAYLLSRLVPRILEEKENYGAPDIGQGSRAGLFLPECCQALPYRASGDNCYRALAQETARVCRV